MRLIMIRHPRTVANERKIVYGRLDALYSEAGEASIPGIVEALHDVKIDRLYSSPLTRTRLLAEKIAEDHRTVGDDGQRLAAGDDSVTSPEIVMDDRILEMDFGKFENMTIPELETTYPVEFAEYRKDFNNYVVPGGESYQQLYQRTVEFLNEIYDRHERSRGTTVTDDGWRSGTGNDQGAAPEETVVVVSHSMVIHAAASYLLHLDLDDVWRIKIEPGSMIDFDWRYDYAMLQGLTGPFNIRKP